MTRLMKKAETKAQVLSRWTQDSVEIFNQVCTKWENFNILLSRHKEDINQQVIKPFSLFEELSISRLMLYVLQLDSLKSNSQSQIIKFTSEIDQFYQRWQQEHPPDRLDMTNLDQYLKLLRKSRREWNELMQNQIRLKYNDKFLFELFHFFNNTNFLNRH